MKLITHEQIMSLNISQKQGYEWIKESFLTKKDCQLPPKISMVEEGHVFYNVMPSLNHNHKIGGIKMVTRLPGRNPSLNSEIFLYNMEDAKLKAILDGNYITAFRTAAVAALAIDTFAKKDFNTIAIMGLGVTASAIMNMLSYTLKDKNINKAEDLNTKLNIDFENLVKENEEFVRKAYLELKDSDLANYTNQIKDEFYEQIGSLEALIEKGNYLMASKKVTEIKALLDINKEELLKPQLSDNDGTSSIGEISGGESSGGTSPDGVSSGGGNAQTPSQSLPNVPSTPSGAVAPSGYSGGLMINWDLTHAINESNANGYRQGINREYFQRYLNGENIEVLLSERKQYPYDEIVNGENKRGLAVDMKVTYTSCNSNDISTLINSQSSIGLSLKEHPLRNKQYDYIESFVVYDGNTNIIYKLGVATGFADPVE